MTEREREEKWLVTVFISGSRTFMLPYTSPLSSPISEIIKLEASSLEQKLLSKSKSWASESETGSSKSFSPPSSPLGPPTPTLRRKPKEVSAAAWMSGIDKQVVAALPGELFDGNPGCAASCVVKLDGNARFGKPETWCTLLSQSSLASLPQAGAAHVYTADGLSGALWFPFAADFGDEVSSMAFDKISSSGFDVHVSSNMNKEHRVICLETAANGISPAIFASIKRGGDRSTPSNPSETAEATSIMVTQRSVFDLRHILSDVITSYHDQRAASQSEARAASLFEVTNSIARKMHALAKLKVLRLDWTAKEVPFVAKLEEREGGRLESVGYQSSHSDVFGVPMLTFGGEMVVRMRDDTSDYTSARYATMMTMLLAAVAAEHGPAASAVMLHRLTGRDPSGKHLATDELPEDHEKLNLFAATKTIDEIYLADLNKRMTEVLKTHPHHHTSSNLDELVQNLRNLKMEENFEMPFAVSLIAHLLNSSSADTRICGRTQPGFDEVAELLRIA